MPAISRRRKGSPAALHGAGTDPRPACDAHLRHLHDGCRAVRAGVRAPPVRGSRRAIGDGRPPRPAPAPTTRAQSRDPDRTAGGNPEGAREGARQATAVRGRDARRRVRCARRASGGSTDRDACVQRTCDASTDRCTDAGHRRAPAERPADRCSDTRHRRAAAGRRADARWQRRLAPRSSTSAKWAARSSAAACGSTARRPASPCAWCRCPRSARPTDR